MGIRRFVISTTEAVKRNAPNATPAKNACRYAAAAFTKIAKLVKNTCRNSYNFASAAVAKITHTVRNILLRRLARRMAADDTNGTYEKISADEVEGLNATLVKTNSCSCSCSFGFLTFAKIGYTVRVKIVYRIVQWISDDGNKFILDQDFGMPVKNEGMNFFAKIVHDVKEWMACPDTKSRFIMGRSICCDDFNPVISMYTTILGDNVRYYVLMHGLIPDGAAFVIILSQTLFDIVNEDIKLSKEKAGSQEFVSRGEKHDKWYSAAYIFLKDKVGVCATSEFLAFLVKEFSAFLKAASFLTQIFSKGVSMMESMVLMMRKFFVFVKKRHRGAGFS